MKIRTGWRDGALFDDGAAGAGAAAAAGDAGVAAAAAAAKPWYEGKADAETVGYWQNKAWKADDPVTIALEATKAAREAQKFVGAPPDQLIRLPKDAGDEAGWNAVWNRLGKPKDAKEYDLSAVKFADGTAIDDGFADMIRQTAFSQHLPKDAATAFAQSVVKFMEGADAAEIAETTAKLNAEKAELAKNWGPNADLNKLTAMQGAKRLGVTPEAVAALEKTIGYAQTMEMFRKVGAGTSEDTFVEGKGTTPTTVASAQARLAELQSDKAWVDRLFKGDAAARREHDNLIAQIAAAA